MTPISWARAQNGSLRGSLDADLAVGGVRRGGPHHDVRAPVVGGPLELADRPVEVGEREVRRREDAVLVREAPVVVEPAVERGERLRDREDVVAEQLLVEDAERREQPDRLEPELVELGDAGVAVAVLGRDRLAVAEELDRRLLVGVAPEVVVHRAGLGDRVEGRVHDRVADPAADHVVLAAVDLAPLHAAAAERGVEVAGEGVERLVVVVVGVEGEKIELGHGRNRTVRPEPFLFARRRATQVNTGEGRYASACRRPQESALVSAAHRGTRVAGTPVRRGSDSRRARRRSLRSCRASTSAALVVSFKAPADNGGTTIHDYARDCTPVTGGKGGEPDREVSPIMVFDAHGRQAVHVPGRAQEPAGYGPYSAPSKVVVPKTEPAQVLPDPPSVVSASPRWPRSRCGSTLVADGSRSPVTARCARRPTARTTTAAEGSLADHRRPPARGEGVHAARSRRGTRRGWSVYSKPSNVGGHEDDAPGRAGDHVGDGGCAHAAGRAMRGRRIPEARRSRRTRRRARRATAG